MRKAFLIIGLLSAGICHGMAASYDYRYNPWSGRMDLVHSSNTLPSGSTHYVHNQTTNQAGSAFNVDTGTCTDLKVTTLHYTTLDPAVSVSPAGNDTNIQYNDSDSFGGSDNFTYNGTTVTLTSGPIKEIMGATQLRSIVIDGATNPLTAENGKPVDIDRVLQRTTASGAISRQESLIDLDVSIEDDDTITSGKSNIVTYYVFDERIDLSGSISGDTNASWALYHQYAGYSGATGITVDSSADISQTFTTVTGWTTPIITLNNAALDYTGNFVGILGHANPDIADTASNSKTTTGIGVKGNAETGGIALDTGYGGWFKSAENTSNYGVYAEGATAALYAKGHIVFDADNTYDIGASAGNWLGEIYQKGTHYFRDTAIHIASADDGHLDLTADGSIDLNANTYPGTDNTYYLGKNDDDTPFAWKGIILKDQAGTGKYYRLEVNGDALQITDLTD